MARGRMGTAVDASNREMDKSEIATRRAFSIGGHGLHSEGTKFSQDRASVLTIESFRADGLEPAQQDVCWSGHSGMYGSQRCCA